MGELPRRPTAADVLAIDEWSHRIGPYEAFGQRYAIWTSDAALAEFLDGLYAPMVISETEASTKPAVLYRVLPPTRSRYGVVLRDRELVGAGRRHHHILGWLQWAVNRQVLENSCGDRLVLHAGGVIRDGLAVVLPAEMESGKTTLTVGLLDRGFGYLSDEAVAVSRDLYVEGYAKPLSIDRGSWNVLRHHEPVVASELQRYLVMQWQVPAASFAPVVQSGRLAAIVFPRYVSGESTVIERLRPADAVVQAGHSTFTQPGSEISSARVRELAQIVSRVPSFRLVSGDLGEACQAVGEVLEAARLEVAGSESLAHD